jgi:acetoin utilization deacetylase AcuC-like enzyme
MSANGPQGSSNPSLNPPQNQAPQGGQGSLPFVRAFYSPRYAAPLGKHRMPIRKFGLVADEVVKWPWVRLEEPGPLGEEDFLRVHDPQYIQAVKTGEPRKLAESQRFPWSPELYPSVCHTSGGLYAAALAALERGGAAAALVSGFHHSHRTRGEGYCTFNGLVTVGERLRKEGKIQRLAVLDLDLHYGNGTAQLAVTRPWLRTLSIYGNDYWEDTTYREVVPCRHQDGENHRSAALPNGSGRDTLMETLARETPWLLGNSPEGSPGSERPDLLLYQAGADPYFEDPYSPLTLNHEDLLARDEWVFRWAKEQGLPIAWVLAGGYTEDVSKVVRVHVNTFEAWRRVWRPA